MLIEVSLYNNTSSIFDSYVEFQKCANSYLDEIKNINISDIKSLEEKKYENYCYDFDGNSKL